MRSRVEKKRKGKNMEKEEKEGGEKEKMHRVAERVEGPG